MPVTIELDGETAVYDVKKGWSGDESLRAAAAELTPDGPPPTWDPDGVEDVRRIAGLLGASVVDIQSRPRRAGIIY